MARKRSTFTKQMVEQHVAKRHPGCPAGLAEHYVALISSREWNPPVTLGRAFGIVTTNDVRHRMTDYERLLRAPGITREEARLIVANEVKDIMSGWARPVGGSEDMVPGPSATRQHP